MRYALLVVLLLVSQAGGLAQEPTCDPCVDGPEMLRTPRRLESDAGQPRASQMVSPSASQIASRIRGLGGQIRDITHDCGIASSARYAQIDFLVRACTWGGRYRAILLEPVSPDDTSTSVVLASNGEVLEVLFDGDGLDAFVESFSGLLKEDFDAMFQALDSPTDK